MKLSEKIREALDAKIQVGPRKKLQQEFLLQMLADKDINGKYVSGYIFVDKSDEKEAKKILKGQ